MNTSIVASGEKQDIGCRVVLWDEPNIGKSFYLGKKKYHSRQKTLAELQNIIKSIVLHHTVSYTAKDTHVGIIGRGLSVNFIIDDDINNDGCATIYQCLDIKDGGYSQTICNESGPGVEICLRPDFWANPELYSAKNIANYKVTPHKQIEDKVHGANFKCFGPTEAQHNSIIRLLNGFFKMFPKLPREFPKNDDGTISKTLIKDPTNYKGVMNHYNLDRQKIDCLGLDLEKIESEIFYPF